MNTFFAVFSDGDRLIRRHRTRVFTHAWRVKFKAHINGDPVYHTRSGFSRSEKHALRAARLCAPWDKNAAREVVHVHASGGAQA